MELNSNGSRTNLILFLGIICLLLPLVSMVDRAQMRNADKAAAVTTQMELFVQHLVASDHGSQNLMDTYKLQIVPLQKQQSETLLLGSHRVLTTAVASCAVVFLLFWLFLRQQLVTPLCRLENVARRLQDDDTEMTVPYANRTDEVGLLARALESLRCQRLSALTLQQSAERSQEERVCEIREQNQRELDREHSMSRKREQDHALELAQNTAASEAFLKLRFQKVSEAVRAAATGNLNYLAENLDHDQRPDDQFGHMVSDLEHLFTQFDRDFFSIKSGAIQLTETAIHLQGLGESISDSAKVNNQKTRDVMTGAQGVRAVLMEVSNNVEQMQSGIQGISQNATQASDVASQAVELAQNTDSTMRKLADSSIDINNVIKLITSIAEQTNLLALNATIEAARAGDAGKGFAVVANEVKELAKETNKATDEIQRRITAICTETGNAVEAIGSINQIVSQIDGLQGDISESVRGQSNNVQTIISLIGNATKDNSTVRGILTEVIERQSMTQTSAAEVRQSSENLRSSAEGNLLITNRYSVPVQKHPIA